jgi:AraC-like DNA-binding protein
LHQNLHREVTLEEMADHAGLSASHFVCSSSRRVFADQLFYPSEGATRLYTAVADASIHEIAYEIGYSDPYYFSRCSKTMGVSRSITVKRWRIERIPPPAEIVR